MQGIGLLTNTPKGHAAGGQQRQRGTVGAGARGAHLNYRVSGAINEEEKVDGY